MKQQKIYLNLPNKLALPEAYTFNRALLTAFHIALAFNWFFALLHLFPIVGLLPALIILWLAQRRRDSFTNSAFKFAKMRLFSHIMIILVIATLGFLPEITWNYINRAYFLLSFILFPLAVYDAYYTSKGGLGLTIIRPLKEAIIAKGLK